MKICRALFAAIAAFTLVSCNQNDSSYQGYVENELTYISSPVSGKLIELPVTRGTTVKKDTVLFKLEQQPEAAELQQANALVKQAMSTVDDLQKGGRPSELSAIESQIAEAQANLDYANKLWERRQKLVTSGNVNIDLFDQATRELKTAEARLAQLQSALTTAKSASRADQINAAKAGLEANYAALTKIEWIINQKTVSAPVDAIVFDTYYNTGEQVAAMAPVVSLLVPANTKAVFFIPELKLSAIHVGDDVIIHSDGAESNIKGKITFISPHAEYTPPVIYSRSSNNKFVYRVEIEFEPAIARQLHPGQPIDVIL